MVVAELEVFHSRPITPTRRVALGDLHLPLDPHPGFGAVLLGAVMAANVDAIHPDMHDEMHRLMTDIEAGRRISQPRLRHRFQADRVGLQRSVHRLIGQGEQLHLELEDRGAPVQQALAAIYTVGTFEPEHRRPVMDVLRRGLRWRGEIGERLVVHLSGRSSGIGWIAIDGDPVLWALELFGMTTDGSRDTDRSEWDRSAVDRRTVQRRFRELLRDAHPDHGGAREVAAGRIAELAEARRILLT